MSLPSQDDFAQGPLHPEVTMWLSSHSEDMSENHMYNTEIYTAPQPFPLRVTEFRSRRRGQHPRENEAKGWERGMGGRREERKDERKKGKKEGREGWKEGRRER